MVVVVVVVVAFPREEERRGEDHTLGGGETAAAATGSSVRSFVPGMKQGSSILVATDTIFCSLSSWKDSFQGCFDLKQQQTSGTTRMNEGPSLYKLLYRPSGVAEKNPKIPQANAFFPDGRTSLAQVSIKWVTVKRRRLPAIHSMQKAKSSVPPPSSPSRNFIHDDKRLSLYYGQCTEPPLQGPHNVTSCQKPPFCRGRRQGQGLCTGGETPIVCVFTELPTHKYDCGRSIFFLGGQNGLPIK